MISAGFFFLLLGLIVFGPKKTIEMTQTIGRVLAQVKHATGEFQSHLQDEVSIRDKTDARSGEGHGREG
jgi:Sec-independent protein translocase protein TatA